MYQYNQNLINEIQISNLVNSTEGFSFTVMKVKSVYLNLEPIDNDCGLRKRLRLVAHSVIRSSGSNAVSTYTLAGLARAVSATTAFRVFAARVCRT